MSEKSSTRRRIEELFRDKEGLCVLRLEDIDFELIINRPYTNTFHEIIIVTEGSVIHSIDGVERILVRGEICALEVGHIHKILKVEMVKGFVLRYKNEFIPSGGTSYKTTFYTCFKGYLGDNEHHLTTTSDELKQCLSLLSQLEREFKQGKNFSVDKGIMQHLLIALVLILERRARITETERVANTKSNDKIIYHEFVELLEKHFLMEHSMTFYANKLGISRRKLSEIIKKFQKKTAKRLHVERIMLEAKRLLAYSNMSLKQIAYYLGFEHPPYFSNRFKEEYHITPNQYRLKGQQKKE